jgi:predicted amidophosphoribosyltransferase
MGDERMQAGMERMRSMTGRGDKRRAATFEEAKKCPACGFNMKYIYGEMYECPECGTKMLSDFGKVREFLDIHGPQPASIISEATGVSLHVIDGYLKQGRVEIPDGSDTYIKCQGCGTDIRYGRFCPECMMKLSKNISQAMCNPDIGEKPKLKKDAAGTMHTMDSIARRKR